jgi:hypothetical protein
MFKVMIATYMHEIICLGICSIYVNYMFNENECRNSTSRSDSSEVIGCGRGIS